MERRLSSLAVAALLLAGCGSESPAPGAAQSATPTPVATATPEPVAALPTTAATIAGDLTATAQALRDGVEAWRRDGDPASGDAPAEVAALAARIERIHRALAPRRRLTARTLRRLGGAVRAEARDVIAARRALDVLNKPRPGQKPPKVRRGPPEPADALLGYYREARARSGVSVKLLAAVNLIESDFGRVRNNSVSGAQGPMQFMPATWRSLRPRRRRPRPARRDPRRRPLPRRRGRAQRRGRRAVPLQPVAALRHGGLELRAADAPRPARLLRPVRERRRRVAVSLPRARVLGGSSPRGDSCW